MLSLLCRQDPLAACQMTEKVRGYLVVTVAEASGRNKDEEEVWDPSFYEGFVKGARVCGATE